MAPSIAWMEVTRDTAEVTVGTAASSAPFTPLGDVNHHIFTELSVQAVMMKGEKFQWMRTMVSFFPTTERNSI